MRTTSLIIFILTASVALAAQKPELAFPAKKPFKDFDVMDLSGKVINTAALRQDKALCITFSNKLPHGVIDTINALAREYPGRVAFVDVVINENIKADEILKYYEETRANLIPTLDVNGNLAKQYDLKQLPLMIVVHKCGIVIFATRTISTDGINRGICEALGLPQPPREDEEE